MAIYLQGEKHRQFIVLMLSSGASLTDAKTLFRIAAVGLERGMVNETDAKSLDEIRQRLDRLTNLGVSRSQAKANKLLRFKPKPNLSNRNEETAAWLADLTGVVPYGAWKSRYGPLVAHSKPYKRAEPRPGTFKKRAPPPIAKIYGAQKVNKELKKLMDTIGMLIKNHSPDSKSRARGERMLASAGKSISTRVSKGG
jgi:hypothetical protein